ncbi:hypothetical protein LK12_14125 [Novosphingobium malaysiense]|uniref:Uncharacterized protein n=1 Tax=Novosphingobium malaysiense TaxID=1348853 RepID=A0A0B1ZS79_9SPHN|nr:hypothetical protein LK12_14125 [Novosphingobium malaysiense]
MPLTALSTAMLLAACVPQPPAPSPSPVRSQAPRPAPTPTPAPQPVEPTTDWRDMAATPGDWTWGRTATGSQATFAGGLFSMRCNEARQTVTLLRASNEAGAQVPMSISTTEGTRALVAIPVPGGIAVSLDARDSLLDAMAFSRGRFAVEAAGSAPLYIPSWTEISRIIEDCR